DNNNFGPSFGLAWSPSFRSGWLGKLFGENKTVWRGGFQISYDAFFTNMISLLLAVSPPNGFSVSNSAPRAGRCWPEFSTRLPKAAPVPSPMDDQRGVLEKDLRSPYTERWSFGFQRELSNKLVFEGSYVGSQSHKLATWANVNPRRLDESYPY